MNKETFLWRLMENLAALDEEERRQVASYYQELVLDGVESGKTEEEVVAGFGDPAEVAQKILEERGLLLEKEAQFEQERREYERLRREHEQQEREEYERHRREYEQQEHEEYERHRREYEQQRQEYERQRREHEQRASGEPREYRAKDSVETVLVQVRNRHVEVRESADGAVRVWFAPQEGERIEVLEANGAFQFVQKASFFGVHGLFGWFNNGGQQAVVEVPHDFAGTVCVQTSEGRIEAKDLTVPGKMQLVTSNSRIAAESCTLGKLSGKTTNGRITLKDVAGDAGEAATSNGRIEARHCTFTEHLWIETSNGAIRAESTGAPDISFRTSNGSIKGSIAGSREEYTVSCKTSNGRCNLRNDGEAREKRLRAITSNGNIHIDFEENTEEQ